MAADKAQDSRSKPRSVKMAVIAVVAVAVIIAALWFKLVMGAEDPTAHLATFVVKRGPLTISVLESGTITSRERITLRNEVEGRTSIVRLVPDGSMVKKGDLLVELDASTLKDAIVDQDIQVQRANAAHIGADETLAVTENQAKSDIEKAELTLKFAKQDLQQYLAGLYPNELKTAEAQITLAREELARAEEKLRSSQKLYDAQYLSESELNADKLAVTKRELDLQLAISDRDVLTKFTYERNIAQYQSDVSQAEFALERTQRKANADIVQAKADLNAKKAEADQQQSKLQKFKDQLAKTRIIAPADGMVVYATSSGRRSPFDRREPLDIGVEVTERQDLISLPTAAAMMAQIDIHETSLEKVRVGLPVVITVDALAGKQFLGRVAIIAPLPDARSMWMNPDLKIYPTDIYLEDNDPALRTGMSCKAEIIVAQYKDAVYIPVSAVLKVAGEPTVYIVKDGKTEERKVELGLDDDRMIHIVRGLEEGEVVILTPPLKSAAIEPGTEPGGAEVTGDLDAERMQDRVNQKLEEANGTGQVIPSVRPGGPDGAGAPSGDRAEQMRRRFENMSDEERQKEMERMKQRFENMSPEEREKMRERLGGGGPRQGRGSRQGAGGGRAGGPRGGESERSR